MEQRQNERVFEVSAQNFQANVLQQSRELPVLLLFWAEQLAVSVEARRTLEALARQYQGRFALGLVDVAGDPTLAQHLQVQALPAIRVVRDEQIIEQLDGPQSEAALRQLLDRLTMTSGELVRSELKELIERKDYDRALAMLRQALASEPQNAEFQVELADLLLLTGELDEGRSLLESIPRDTAGRERPAARLELIEEAGSLPGLAELREALAADEDNLELRYHCAIRAAAEGAYEEALEHAMHILQRDRAFGEDAGRRTMIRIFDMLGKGSELATRYRRRMFNVMH